MRCATARWGASRIDAEAVNSRHAGVGTRNEEGGRRKRSHEQKLETEQSGEDSCGGKSGDTAAAGVRCKDKVRSLHQSGRRWDGRQTAGRRGLGPLRPGQGWKDRRAWELKERQWREGDFSKGRRDAVQRDESGSAGQRWQRGPEEWEQGAGHRWGTRAQPAARGVAERRDLAGQSVGEMATKGQLASGQTNHDSPNFQVGGYGGGAGVDTSTFFFF